jgi:SAM-dependent methyltransferase
MRAKPSHLTDEHAARFQDQRVVEVYPLRAPYPPEVFDILVDLIVDQPRAVLDVGTGTGDLARPLAGRVARVDAVDPSAAMLALARSLPGGDRPTLRWIHATAEQAPLEPPYALVTAGESLHWMDWEVVLPRFAASLTPGGMLAIVHRTELELPWLSELFALIARTVPDYQYQHFDLIVELEQRRLFTKIDARETAPLAYRQTVDDYILALHSMSSLSRAVLTAQQVAAFDAAVAEMVAPWVVEGKLPLRAAGSVVWGKPHAPDAAR